MKQPKLSVGAFGEDVARLHRKLIEHGSNIPTSEVERNFFGPATREAVRELQEKKGISPSGEMDVTTHAALANGGEDRPSNSMRTTESPNSNGNGTSDHAEPPRPPEPSLTSESTPNQPTNGERFVVRGLVAYVQGLLIPDVTVRAFNKDLRNEDFLGEAITDEEGRYEISYSPSQFTRTDKPYADLILRVFDLHDSGGDGGRDPTKPLVESPVIFNARPVEKVRLMVDGGLKNTWSEYEQTMDELAPALGTTPITALSEDENNKDITVLRGQTGIPARRIAFLVVAHKLAEKSGLPPEVFYGLFRQNLPTTMPELLAQSPDIQKRAIVAAIQEHIIPGRLNEAIEAFLAGLKQLIVTQAFEPPREQGKASFAALLSTALTDTEQQKEFLTSYVNHVGPIEDFWKDLRAKPEFKDKVENLQVTLQLGALTNNQPQLTETLQQMRGTGEFQSLRDLARFDENDWKGIIATAASGGKLSFPPEVPGANDEEKANNYAQTMKRVIADAFPTEVLAHSLQKGENGDHSDLRTFFKNVVQRDTGFELAQTHIEDFVSKNPDVLNGVSDEESLLPQLQGAQRLFRLSTEPGTVLPLLNQGVDSALAITRMGTSAFETQFEKTLGPIETAKVYENASRVTATALSLFGSFNPALNTGLNVLPGTQTAVEGIPDWETLFGSAELCACTECRSVHSPAAYLVEILAFLKERKSKTATLSAKDILFQRRPDLGDIELSCDNTNTLLPYVDLINEVLEDAISPFVPFALAADLVSELSTGPLSESLRASLIEHNIELTADATCVEVMKGAKWFITDRAQLYSIENVAGQLEIISRSHQTAGTEQELGAYPQHINPGAYETLRRAVYPLTLPFDLWLSEARVYLDHLGVPRHELMQLFQQQGTSPNPSDAEIAAEYLGLTNTERQIITGNVPNQSWEFWGLQENDNEVRDVEDPRLKIKVNWLDALSRVRNFLDRSGLNYEELVALLKTRFINPPGSDIHIEATKQARNPENNEMVQVDPATCDTSKLIISSLDQPAANRFHRFVRLWRKLDWSIADLDNSIAALRSEIADVNFRLDDTFLLRLSNARRLQAELRLPVDRLLTFWSNIEATGDKSLHQRLFQNPAVIKPVDAAFKLKLGELEIVTAAPEEAKISKHAPAILAALGISNADLVTLTATEVKNDELNLTNLTRLCRVSVFSRSLKLSISQFLTLKTLTALNPFDVSRTEDALRFMQIAQKLRDSGFRVEELAYLLQPGDSAFSNLAPTDESIALVLDDIRSNLQKTVDETTVEPDLSGDLTRKKLALLKWDSALVEQAIGTLNGSVLYETTLTNWPAGLVLPAGVRSKATFVADDKEFVFSGPMTQDELTTLLSASTDVTFQTAVRQLFEAPRDFVSSHMKAFGIPTLSVPLDVLPPGLAFPSNLRNKIYFDKNAKQVSFVGVMSKAEQTELLELSPDVAYQTAINSLFNAPAVFVPDAADSFLTAADVAQLFDAPTTPEQRFATVLVKLMPYLRATVSTSLVKQKLGEVFRVESKTVERLLTVQLNSPTRPDKKVIEDFLTPAFAESNEAIAVTRDAFPEQFRAFSLLHKVSLLVSKFRITSKQLQWLGTYGTRAGWLDLNSLPLSATDSAASFVNWEKLADLFLLRDQLAAGEATLSEILALAADPETKLDPLLQKLSDLTGWATTELGTLTTTLQVWDGSKSLNLSQPAAYLGGSPLARIKACLAMMKRLGTSAARCFEWAKAELSDLDARNITQTAKAKYEDDQWLVIAKPLRDLIRGQQRSALVGYMVAHPGSDAAKQEYWRDANGLYEYFLIDVEMDPCMMTSRIKQAISSVQLFVQRCLLNLERNVRANETEDVHWRDWKWMKLYRVWEANRKVFLYPENWIEPGLRDDKSPFFKDLENELMQNEVTQETAEDAFLHYLEKMDAVARLEVVGLYHQQDEGTDVLHVFGRSRGTPHIYFYRKRIDSARWTAWEKLDLDIEGDHLIPVVWNRRLYLFWPIFIEKANENPVVQKTTIGLKTESNAPTEATTPGGAPTQPEKHWEIQLAWSEYKSKKWLPKKITSSAMRSYLEPEPNDRDRSRLGHVFYGIPDTQGGLSIFVDYYYTIIQPPRDKYYSPALRRVAGGGKFYFTGCGGDVSITTYKMAQGVPQLRGTTRVAMGYQQVQNGLYLPKQFTTAADDVALRRTLSDPPYSLLFPHQDRYLTGQRPFFFQDDKRTFFVSSEQLTLSKRVWRNAELVQPTLIDRVSKAYYATQPTFALASTVAAPSIGGFARAAVGATGGVDANIALATPVRTASLISSANAFNATLAVRDSTSILSAAWPHPAPAISVSWKELRYKFQTFYHPYLCLFIRSLNWKGVDGLLQRGVQLESSDFFKGQYNPTDLVIKGATAKEELFPRDDVDFTYGGAYAQYNWEVFFHAPLLIAGQLGQNQRFEEAQRWFHYIFDPTDISSNDAPQKYWRTRPFYQTTRSDYQQQQIENLLQRLASDQPEPELENQVNEWRSHPFNPHLIARLRTTAYQKTVVMKYLDNLIAWGDQLFRRFSIESNNEASQLYVLAAEILGRRPVVITPRVKAPVQTFNSLDPKLADFSNRLVQIEHYVPPPSADTAISTTEKPPLPVPLMLYFCVTQNEKLLSYWDTVADRLCKIRHCMNIEGVVGQPPLFEPPIDPAMLVRAVAAGIDISSALSDVNAALPYYRFNVLVQKAAELTAEVKTLGQALLSALEKRDAESLALLRSSQEINLLNKVREVKEKQVKEAITTWEGLSNTKKVTEARRDYYRDILRINEREQLHLDKMEAATILQSVGQGIEILAGALALIPNFKVGIAGAFGSPQVGMDYGGFQLSSAVQVASRVLSLLSAIQSYEANRASIMGGFDRRWDDWKLQEKLANLELSQIQKQIDAADIRKQIVDQEVKNHDLQVENAKATDAFMRDKFTNRELYDWMVGQISGLYFQSYQLAYDIAKRAERAYRFELGLEDSNFIKFGYWDSLKKGLLAGEQLHQALKRMEMAYLDQNKREYEITKHVSISTVDPLALLKLKETGECFVNLPESLFDIDHPGQYMRRLRSVSLTIPCVTGPYTGINCKLTLLGSSIRRLSTLRAGQYRRDTEIEDPRFKDSVGAIQSIAMSNGQNDSGLFELNFRDERYLPFEGAGAISNWRIELAKDFRLFDYDTISDVIIHLRYTAREGGEALRQHVGGELQEAINDARFAENRHGLFRSFSLKQEFPGEWYRFLNSPDPQTGDHLQEFPITQDRFPFYLRGRELQISKTHLLALPKNGSLSPFDAYLTPPGTGPSETNDRISLETDTTLGGLLHKERSYPKGQEKEPGPTWTLKVKSADVPKLAKTLDNIALVFEYSVA